MKTQKIPEKPIFEAVDGEGFTDKTGHHYNLMVRSCWDQKAKDGSAIGAYCVPQNGKRLTSTECFDFLTTLGRDSRRVFVAFSFGYDVTKWLEDWLPEERILLWKNTEYTWYDDNGREYEVTFIPHKLFRLRFLDEEISKYRTLTIYDTFGFFQTSFVKALKDWGFEKELQYIQEMKDRRSSFEQSQIEEIALYSKMECDLLCQLMNRVRDALWAEKIYIKKWLGAGAIGEQILRREGAEESIAVPEMRKNICFQRACMGAYFGGRTELFRQGIINETHQYDINSAYPYAMSTLPDFKNCKIEFCSEYDPNQKYSVWFVKYNVIDAAGTPLPGPLPYRTKTGRIIFPHKNRDGVWVHQVELQNAILLYGNKYFQIQYGYKIRVRTGKPRFTFIPELAAKRLELKRAGDQRNKVLKLGLNSLYGKTAQQISNDGRIPAFQNFYIAGYITAFCRAQLLRVGFSCGDKGSGLIQFATDGIFSMVPSTIVGKISSTRLGGWEYTCHKRRICYLQPGVYFTEKSKTESGFSTKRRTRGFGAERLSSEDVFREWTRNGTDGQLSATDKRFVGIGYCIVLRKWDTYGRFIPMPHVVTFLPSGKSYLTGANPAPPFLAWKRRILNVVGIPKHEVENPNRMYEIFVSWWQLVDGPSRPKKQEHADKATHIDNYNEELQAEIIQDILLDDQPDYVTLLGFIDE